MWHAIISEHSNDMPGSTDDPQASLRTSLHSCFSKTVVKNPFGDHARIDQLLPYRRSFGDPISYWRQEHTGSGHSESIPGRQSRSLLDRDDQRPGGFLQLAFQHVLFALYGCTTISDVQAMPRSMPVFHESGRGM